MARPKKKPNYDPNKVMNDLLDTVVDAYDKSFVVNPEHGELKMVASELDMTPIKIRKLLITAGIRDDKEYYSNDRSTIILDLYKQGNSIEEIMRVVGLTRASVCGYLPYSKCIYKARELSVTAERIHLYRKRQKLCESFNIDISLMTDEESENYLWNILDLLQGCMFKLSSPVCDQLYKYKIEKGELLVGKNKMPIKKSIIMFAFMKVREIQKKYGYVTGPEMIGVHGSEYLYPIFQRLGICNQPGEIGS